MKLELGDLVLVSHGTEAYMEYTNAPFTIRIDTFVFLCKCEQDGWWVRYVGSLGKYTDAPGSPRRWVREIDMIEV